jgi:predicted permease
MLKKKGVAFDEYLAGGCLANVPILIFIYVVKSLPEDIWLSGLELGSLLAVALGGMCAGYAVARRADLDHSRVGLKTGLAAFLVNIVLSSIISEGPTILYGLWILMVFCVFSVSGAILRSSRAKRANSVQTGPKKSELEH